VVGNALKARATFVLLITVSLPASASAQQPCRILCGPSVTLMPAAVITHLFVGPEVRSLSTGVIHRLPSKTNFEMIASFGVRTGLPRTSLYASVQWLPWANESGNPFTLYSASELGDQHVRANAPTVSLGASFSILTPEATRSWGTLAANIGDLYSQAARPSDESSYTHKLDLELVAHVTPFSRLDPHSYLSRTAIFAILDYVATGLPRAGDEVPQGERVYLTDARPTTLLMGAALPLTPKRGQ
jgi:hypothetical protein